MLCNAHREQVYHSQREGLSVGQSSSVSERSGQPVVKRVAKSHDRSGQPVVERGQELNTEHAQWTFSRYQSTCVFPTSSNSWRNAQPFYRNAEPQRRAAKHLGHTWYISGNVFFFKKSSCVLFSTLSAGIESMEFGKSRTDSLINGGEEGESNTSSRSEMPVWTVSQKFCHR